MSGEKSISQQHLSNDICVRCMLYLFQSILKQHLNYFPKGPVLVKVHAAVGLCIQLALKITAVVEC